MRFIIIFLIVAFSFCFFIIPFSNNRAPSSFHRRTVCLIANNPTSAEKNIFSELRKYLQNYHIELLPPSKCPNDAFFTVSNDPAFQLPFSYLLMTQHKKIEPLNYQNVFMTSAAYQKMKNNRNTILIPDPNSEQKIKDIAEAMAIIIAERNQINNGVQIYLNGGLGNQLFEYATAKSYAWRFGKQVYFVDDKSNIQKSFLIKEKTAKDIKHSFSYFYDKKIQLPHIAISKYCAACFDNPYLTHIKGYTQSWKNIKDFLPKLQETLIFKPFDTERNKELAKQLAAENSVAIHVRMGDYVFYGYPLLSQSFYYERAIDYIKKHVSNPKFYVFTDDPKSLKETFHIDTPYTLVTWNNTPQTSFRDMQLMSLCKHNIIANSTFSWWAAALNKNPDKIVIYPDVWLTWDENWLEHLRVPEWIEIKSGIQIKDKKLFYPSKK